MAKRGPTSELNHDNWNDEVESEEAGTFKVAAPAELETRKILRPKRKLQESNPPAPSNPFSNLSGFAPAAPIPASSANASYVEPAIPLSTESESNQAEPVQESSPKIENGKVDLDQPGPNNENKSNRDESNPVVQIDQSNNSARLSELEHQNDNSVEANQTNNEKENPNEELDLPDFVDQSDEEEEMEPSKLKGDKSDSEENPESD